MAAALAIALLAASAAPAAAGFRYVPPGETGAAQAEEIARSSGAADIEPPPGPGLEVSGTSVPGTSVSGTRVWRVAMRARCCAPCWRAGQREPARRSCS